MTTTIAKAMDKRKVTAAALAEGTGLSERYIYNLRKGTRPVSVRAALLVAPHLGLDARKLLIEQLDRELVEAQS